MTKSGDIQNYSHAKYLYSQVQKKSFICLAKVYIILNGPQTFRDLLNMAFIFKVI